MANNPASSGEEKFPEASDTPGNEKSRVSCKQLIKGSNTSHEEAICEASLEQMVTLQVSVAVDL